MKSLKYFLISFVLFFSVSDAFSCGPLSFSPRCYYMYRVYESIPETELPIEDCYPGAGRNCEEWQRLTSKNIPLEDIYNVVYKMSLKEYKALYDNRGVRYENKFAEWITKRDTAILDFLLLAKSNEYIRLKVNSRWYYPTMEINAPMTLEEIPARALAVNDARLRDRYLLQAVRALFSQKKFEECIALWESEASLLPENNLMRRLIQPYIAGAEFRVNNSKKAITYFAQLGDVNSMLFCAGRAGEKLSTEDALELVCEYAPNSRYIVETLQKYVRGLEPLGGIHWCEESEINVSEQLFSLCLRMAQDKRVENRAMWYYTAAFLSDLKGDAREASCLLSQAEKSSTNEYIKESVKVFRIYLDAKTHSYDASYESKLFAQLKWLDSKIVNCIDKQVIDETARGYKLQIGISYYYWNDVMRRILLGEVCPRMIKAGKTTRALQLANMADNRLLGIVDKKEATEWTKKGDECNETIKRVYTMSSFRYSDEFNPYDYSNSFFEMIDSLGVSCAVEYVENVKHPQSEFDRYLNARGYTNRDYLYDILGTQSLRNMRYADAVNYFQVVSPTYKNHLNVRLYYDPFSIGRKSIDASPDFKYEFARKMDSLERNIKRVVEPNRKARLLVKYATGIKNSFDVCWALTQYYRGFCYYGQVCRKRDWESDKYTKAADARVAELINSATKMVTDDEVAAEMQYELFNFKTVAEKYPYTEKGKLVRGECDNLYDHNPMSRRSRCNGWYQ